MLDEVDAIAPNQAVAYNLRGEILLERGQIDEAEAALRNALTADPQLLSARYNLARVPFARKNFEAARKELEALLGAFSGAGEERREQLIRYQIYLTLLLGGHEGAAQKALDEFKMMDGSPALYFAQAAWAFQHGNPKQGKNWVANAGNLFPAEWNRGFAAPFADLGWLNNAVASATSSTPEPIVVKNEVAQGRSHRHARHRHAGRDCHRHAGRNCRAGFALPCRVEKRGRRGGNDPAATAGHLPESDESHEGREEAGQRAGRIRQVREEALHSQTNEDGKDGILQPGSHSAASDADPDAQARERWGKGAELLPLPLQTTSHNAHAPTASDCRSSRCQCHSGTLSAPPAEQLKTCHLQRVQV